MEWLNYHHLLYFFLAVREGGISAAARHLRLAQPTVSGQIRALEKQLGGKLLERQGRGVALTELGRTVYVYADGIFGLGNELLETVRGGVKAQRLVVGIADVLPKLLAYRLLKPAIELIPNLELVCRQDHIEQLLADLSVHRLDVVLADTPLTSSFSVKASSHLLGESQVSLFAAPALAKRMKRKFPESLNDAPILLPGEHTVLGRSLTEWLDKHQLHPKRVAVVSDSALLKSFGQAGLGVFAAPSVIEKATCNQYEVQVVARLEEIYERFYAISVARRINHPGVVAISKGGFM